MHSCNDLFKTNEAQTSWQLLRWRSSGVCPPATANCMRRDVTLPGCFSTGTWTSSSLRINGRTRTSSKASHGRMRACCKMGRLMRDKHLSARVKRMLVPSVLRPLLEYGAEVLVPTREHCRALRSVRFKTARMFLRCPPNTSLDVTRADTGLQLLSSRRDIAKLKRQHRVHGLPAGRLERVLYERGLPAPAHALGRHRRTWRRVVDCIWCS